MELVIAQRKKLDPVAPQSQVDAAMDALDLTGQAREIRRLALSMIYQAGSGHPGGSLSCADLMAYLWTKELCAQEWISQDAENDRRPRLILSKGHSCPALYAAAALAGLIPYSVLPSFRKLGSPLQGHPHVLDTPWAGTSTGSLGQGFSVGIGMALGLRHKGSVARVYVILGDGELQEGMVWEGAMFAGHYGLGNLCGIVDYNRIQSDDFNRNVIGLEPLRAKWEAFNWHVIEIDGHNFESMDLAFSEAQEIREQPSVIIAHTVKGKGVSFMEGSPVWHGSVKLSMEELIAALRDLDTPDTVVHKYVNGFFGDE